ncbi:unnamed protein product [Protopolystoma xenopodis]|uniref:Uncharacterized protein n=1 Tax=Protopolystoma xenopodis TaxID=117903 RepID=A0A3S4ZVH2_9PLAT|nr:unnamed protein product [Protopolystoma xenopodis]
MHQQLSEEVGEDDLALGRLYPRLSETRRVAHNVARKTVLMAAEEGRCHAHISKDNVDDLLNQFSYYPPPL